MKKVASVVLACVVFLSFSVHSAGITRSVFTTKIINKEPVSKLEQIQSDVTRVYFFTEITGLNGHAITHRWEYNGQVMAALTFHVSGDRWRTWSSKNMLPGWLGIWKVSVLDEGGNLIEQSEFEYVATPEPVTSEPAAPESGAQIQKTPAQAVTSQ